MKQPEGEGWTAPTLAWKRTFRQKLLRWFHHHARDLPWRRAADMYSVWISEIMLQQTQVQTVVPYYERFLAALPDVAALAAAPEEKVLRLWEGLGYYRRARQLHQAAQTVMQRHGGRLPERPEELLALPGIGRYTAGAILSIALDAHQPVLEANTIRLLSRLIAYRDDPQTSAGQQVLWTLAQDLLPRRRAGRFNQALMELGSQVCTPKDPACHRCPVQRLCPTRAQGLQSVVPRRKRKRQYEQVWEAAVVIRRNGKVLLRQCGAAERWAGLWDFPRFAVEDGVGPRLHREIIDKAAELTGMAVRIRRHIATIKHGVTRFRITLSCHEAACVGGRKRGSQLRWVPLPRLEQMPLSATGRQISRLL